MSGKQNVEADALSRIRWTEEDATTLDQATRKAIIDMGNTGKTAWAETYTGMLNIPDIRVRESKDDRHVLLKGIQVEIPQKMSQESWKQEQKAEPEIAQILELIFLRELFIYKVSPKESPALKTMLRHRQQFVDRNGLLYKKCKNQVQDLHMTQFVLPKKFRIQAMQVCHNEIGHLGIERSLALLTEQFY